MRKSVLAALIASGALLASLRAEAMPVQDLVNAPPRSDISRVAYGCGAGFVRGPAGICRPLGGVGSRPATAMPIAPARFVPGAFVPVASVLAVFVPAASVPAASAAGMRADLAVAGSTGGAADEVAALAGFLADDAAKNITGAIIPIDGGWTAA